MDELVQRYEIPNLKDRVETGPVRFNDDWTGVFFRGDNALHYAMLLRYTIENYLKDDIDVLTRISSRLRVVQTWRINDST